jgi:hypothetical protein
MRKSDVETLRKTLDAVLSGYMTAGVITKAEAEDLAEVLALWLHERHEEASDAEILDATWTEKRTSEAPPPN